MFDLLSDKHNTSNTLIALTWWENLDEGMKRHYEFQTFGAGEPYEDNTLCNADIEHMYEIYKF